MNFRDMKNYGEKYASGEHDFENIMVKFRREKVLQLLENYHAKNILEIGCGMDSLFNYYKNYETFTLIEPAKVFFDKALKDANKNKKIFLINDFLENTIPHLKNKNFDFIVCSSLIHEVDNPSDFLNQIFLLMKNNCIVHINVPNSKSFHLLWAYESGLVKEIGKLTNTAKQLQQNTTFDIQKLLSFIEVFGDKIKILDSGSYFIKPFNHSKMSECLKDEIINYNLLNGLNNMIKYMPDLGAEIFVNFKKI
ncbi:class I SAM-dependent methyltransferase [Campylobacter sp. RKI_CA19_01116]|uniref:class I SAM-dependent methyltransferase n=1 Tax=Campylobacter sp. RKI_CA19_01116 TaxID=2911625 RepID=UPI0021E96D53|nr:class I SAM-dependent methyltransferase [Campylobacter sp. RKI_CA19_01116]MCV3396300.1 class I SAM-dependent methyltransferase [Campylobacter sp. RKI_CA19_01116]